MKLRVSSVVQVVQKQDGIAPKRLTSAGRGEYKCVAVNSTEKGKQRNSCTQIFITLRLVEILELIDEDLKDE